MPCSPEHASGPWTRAARCAYRCRAGQQQPRPTHPHVSDPAHSSANTGESALQVYTYNGEILKRPSLLNVLQRLLQILQLLINHGLGLLCALHSLGLECLDGLNLARDVVGGGLESLELLLDVVDDGRVLQHGAVVGEVDRLRLLRQNSHLAARIVVALLEGREGGRRLALQAQLRADLGPVELEGGAALLQKGESVFPGFSMGRGAIAGLRAKGRGQLSCAELQRAVGTRGDVLRQTL